jgi:hypothetical protein
MHYILYIYSILGLSANHFSRCLNVSNGDRNYQTFLALERESSSRKHPSLSSLKDMVSRLGVTDLYRETQTYPSHLFLQSFYPLDHGGMKPLRNRADWACDS